MENQENSLVSIIVITYNSSKYVSKTLESAKAQTYQNIELIISDDGSYDDTLKICEDWLKINSARFTRSEIVKSVNNTGVAANCNRGLSHSKGEYIKFIAGDDLLLKECIQKSLDFIKNSEYKVVFSRSVRFKDVDSNSRVVTPNDGFSIPTDLEKQFKMMLQKDFVNSPTCFINHTAINELGGFDERFPYMEDYPMWLKFIINGYPLGYLPEVTVMYRIHGGSLSNYKKRKVNEKWLKSYVDFFSVVLEDLLIERKLYWRWFYSKINFSILLILNKTDSVLIYFLLKVIIKPFHILNKFI